MVTLLGMPYDQKLAFKKITSVQAHQRLLNHELSKLCP
jgi:hypothetical protein